MFNRILVPLDGSDLAEEVLGTVKAVAERFQSQIILVRVSNSAELHVAEAFAGVADSAALIMQLRARYDYKADAYLQELKSVLQEEGLAVKTMVPVDTDIAASIIDCAHSVKADVIMMSTHGRSGLGRWVLGSVAERVLRSSRIPVLVCRSH